MEDRLAREVGRGMADDEFGRMATARRMITGVGGHSVESDGGLA
jgi:hypothetical protein